MNILNKLQSALEHPITKEILEYYGVSSQDDIRGVIQGDTISSILSVDCLVTNNDDLILFGHQHRCDQFLYYLGSEKEAYPVAMFNKMTIYSGVSEGRYEHRITEISSIASKS